MKTRVTELLGITYPIIQGGMAWVATHELASIKRWRSWHYRGWWCSGILGARADPGGQERDG